MWWRCPRSDGEQCPAQRSVLPVSVTVGGTQPAGGLGHFGASLYGAPVFSGQETAVPPTRSVPSPARPARVRVSGAALLHISIVAHRDSIGHSEAARPVLDACREGGTEHVPEEV